MAATPAYRASSSAPGSLVCRALLRGMVFWLAGLGLGLGFGVFFFVGVFGRICESDFFGRISGSDFEFA